METRLAGSLARRDTNTCWICGYGIVEEGFLDAANISEDRRIEHKGHGIVKFYTTTLHKASCEDETKLRDPGRPPPGGDLRDPAIASCASMAARRLHDLADLAARQTRDGELL
ncbi:MAG: hypothetical protein ACKPKO_55850, partial [Candidatus Fonsibacter sp.]